MVASVAMLLVSSCSRNTIGSHRVLCSEGAAAAYTSVDQVPPDILVRLILGDQDRTTDCTGRSFEPGELALRCAQAARPGTPSPLPIRVEDVVVQPLSDGMGLVGLPVEAYTTGDQTLLVALVHASKRALSVLGIGTVRLPPEQTAVALARIRGEDLLLAQGAECAVGTSEGQCDQTLKILMLYDGRFVPLEMRDADATCHGEAAVSLFRSQDVRLSSGWIRRFELVSTYEVADEGLLINEQLVATDRPPNGDAGNARSFRNSDARRTLEFSGAYFVYDRESLWTGMREVRGDLQPSRDR